VDPLHIDADPDLTYSMRIRTRLFTLMRIRIQIQVSKKAQTLEKVLKFHTFWLDICKLIRIRIRFRIQLIYFDADPYVDPDPQQCYVISLPVLSASSEETPKTCFPLQDDVHHQVLQV
jgi:hypothetical protein